MLCLVNEEIVEIGWKIMGGKYINFRIKFVIFFEIFDSELRVWLYSII